MTATVFLILCGYAAFVGMLYLSQDRLMFPAPPVPVDAALPDEIQPVVITTPDGEKLRAFYAPPGPGEPVILVFHGNGDAALYQIPRGQRLVKAGFGVLLVEYRGYGNSTGTPGETGLITDAEASWDFVAERTDSPIGLYAHSLGTAVAVQLAARREVFALVLESPFDSMLALARHHYRWVPVSLFLKHRFRSDLVVGNIKVPILLLHGDRDQVVPIAHGRALAAKAPEGTEFRVIAGARHNDLPAFGTENAAIAFFRTAAGMN